MDNKKKLVVGMASIWAGGGHHALRDFLAEELEKDPRFDLKTFNHTNTGFDSSNDQLWGKLGNIYEVLYKYTPHEYSSVSAIGLVKECDQFVKKYNPDIVISSNFGIAGAFALVKKSLKLNFFNIFAIPDYGIPSSAALPRSRYLTPDFIIVFDERAKTGIAKKLKFPKERILVSGYIARKSFRDLIATNAKKSKEELVKEIKIDLGKTFGSNISSEKRTMIITGGAGGIVGNSWGLLKKIAEHQKEDEELKQKIQLLVITGKNTKFFNKLFKFHIKKDQAWENIIPIPWIDHETYSKLQLLADFPIMVSIAPASMNELFESKCGPLLIHNSRKGQETPNVKFAVQNKFGYYLPKKKDALKYVINGFSKHENEEFVERVKKYKEVRLGRIKKLPDDIVNIYSQYKNPARKTDIKRLNLDLNLKWISPKLWLSLVILMLPLSVIYGFVQYYRQKDRMGRNKYVKSLINFISQLNPF